MINSFHCWGNGDPGLEGVFGFDISASEHEGVFSWSELGCSSAIGEDAAAASAPSTAGADGPALSGAAGDDGSNRGDAAWDVEGATTPE